MSTARQFIENEDSDIWYGWTKDGQVITAPRVQHDEDAHHIVQQRRLLPDGNPEGWKRWRYRADLETIFWWETPTLTDREATEGKILDLGHYRVDKQVYVGLHSQKPGDRERARKEKMPNFDLDDMEQGEDRLASLAGSDMMDVTHIPDAPTAAMRRWLDRIGDSIESVKFTYRPPDGENLYHRVLAREGDKIVGELAWWFPSKVVAEISSIVVEPAYRRQGIGTKLHAQMKKILLTRFPQAKYVGGEVLNKASLSARRKVHGVADYHATEVDELSVQQVDDLLPDLNADSGEIARPDSGGGSMVTSGPKIYVRNKIREAVDAFHGTDAVFDRFEFTNDIGFHFGSAETANARLNQMSGEGAPGEGANIRPVTLDIKNPLRMPDLHDWDPADVAASLVDLGIISQEQADAVQIVDQDQVQAWLGAHGYDAIVYANDTEAGGDSYIVFDPSLIHPRFGSSKG